MKKLIFFVVFFFFYNICYSQKPLSKELIESKLDSLLEESNQLYNLIIRSKKLNEYLFNRYHLARFDFTSINYYSGDTLISTVLLKDNKIIRLKHEEDTFYYHLVEFNPDELSMIEKNYFDAKRILIEESSKNKEARLPVNFFYELYFLGMPFESKLYQLSETHLPDVIPFGGDYLYQKAGDKIKQIGFYNFHPQNILPENDQIILVYKDAPFIHPTDICKFRFYCSQRDLVRLHVYSRINRTMFVYNRKANELKTEE
jgi:hypothetical protein